MSQTLNIIKTKSEVDKLIKYLSAFDYVAYDTETTGVDIDATIVGLSVCAEENIGYYVVLSYWDKEKQQLVDLETKSVVDQLIECLRHKSLIMHNCIFDCRVTNSNFNIELINSVHTDTMELAHLLDENRRVGLKDLSFTELGQSAKQEQEEMKTSVIANGGKLTKDCYELYKADAELLGKYGAKDAILTYFLFLKFVPELFDQKLNKFFYDQESMPLLRGPTYTMNTVGLKVDVKKLDELESTLKYECLRLKEEVMTEITPRIKTKYPGTTLKNTFNIDSPSQLSWLLFIEMEFEFTQLTDAGKELAKQHGDGRVPYNPAAKKRFIESLQKASLKPEKYIKTDKNVLMTIAMKHKWVSKLLEYKKLTKMLGTYVMGIKERLRYGIIHPSFLQHGTTSGRYSSRDPNFQNLPRDDKRIKSCIIAREGKVFVGADYSQLEPRIFASFAQDAMLLLGFEKNEDFYSVIGIPVFNKYECSANKKADNWFGKTYEFLRTTSKIVALSVTYGTTAYKLAQNPDLRDESGNNFDLKACQKIIDDYMEAYPGVKKLMLDSHEEAKTNGYVINLFGRPRRIPEAKLIKKFYRSVSHAELPYKFRTLLNLAINHKIQSSGASVVNRSALALTNELKKNNIEGKVILQVHDSIIVECNKNDAETVKTLMKDCMENTCKLPGVKLIAEPKIGKNLSEV